MRRIDLITNDTGRTDEAVLLPVFAAVRDLRWEGTVALRVLPARGDETHGRSYWGDSVPQWARGAQFSVTLRVPHEPSSDPNISYHARVWDQKDHDDVRHEIISAWQRGERTFRRWPITRVWTWEEAVAQIAGHEFYHVHQWATDAQHMSEIACEKHSAHAIDVWRETHPVYHIPPIEGSNLPVRMAMVSVS